MAYTKTLVILGHTVKRVTVTPRMTYRYTDGNGNLLGSVKRYGPGGSRPWFWDADAPVQEGFMNMGRRATLVDAEKALIVALDL